MLKNAHLFALGMALAPFLGAAAAPPSERLDCSESQREVALASATGSVGFIKNLAEDPSSLRVVAGHLLTKALADEPRPASAGCAPNCSADARAEVVYRVTPTAFLAAGQQRDVCRRFESETTLHPLEFNQRSFRNVAELNDWIMEFSQGRGDDGKLLYQRCSSNCSPRYTFLIAEQNSGYAVRASVLCGLARDKSNENYRISTAVRRSCAVN